MDRKKPFQIAGDSAPPNVNTVHQQCIKPLNCEDVLSFFREGGHENGVNELSVPDGVLVCQM